MWIVWEISKLILDCQLQICFATISDVYKLLFITLNHDKLGDR